MPVLAQFGSSGPGRLLGARLVSAHCDPHPVLAATGVTAAIDPSAGIIASIGSDRSSVRAASFSGIIAAIAASHTSALRVAAHPLSPPESANPSQSAHPSESLSAHRPNAAHLSVCEPTVVEAPDGGMCL